MIIAVGSENPVKLNAVKEVIEDYDFLRGAEVRGYSVDSGVRDQPFSLDEAGNGAINRARNAFDLCGSCDYSFGLESGTFLASDEFGIHLEATICAVYDGKEFGLGLSPGFPLPKKVVRLMISNNIDLSKAVFEAGLADIENVGWEKGIVDALTGSRMDRIAYTKPAIIMALAPFDRPELYS